MSGEYIPPLERITGFREDRNSHGTSHPDYFHELRREGEAVCRAGVAPVDYPIGDHYNSQLRYPNGAARINYIETREGFERQGFAKELVEHLIKYHRPRQLVGFSEDADDFWIGIGWTSHYHPEGPSWQTFFTAPTFND